MVEKMNCLASKRPIATRVEAIASRLEATTTTSSKKQPLVLPFEHLELCQRGRGFHRKRLQKLLDLGRNSRILKLQILLAK